MPIFTNQLRSYESSCTASAARSIKLGMREAAQAGRHTGPIPTGYRKDRSPMSIPGVPIPDPVQGPLIAKAFEMALAGMTLRTLLSEMQSLGLTGREGSPISLATLARALSNPFYAGLIRYEGKNYRGWHEALISPADFRRVQLLLARRRCS
jgi:site-specific DNA recombinase